jgi:hypothetical protein
MKMFPLMLALAMVASAVQAQTASWPAQPGASAMDQHRYQADQNRVAMERMRRDADQREAQARQAQTDTEAARRRLEATLPPAPSAPAPVYTSRSPQQDPVTQSRRQAADGAAQIDRWLDRGPR